MDSAGQARITAFIHEQTFALWQLLPEHKTPKPTPERLAPARFADFEPIPGLIYDLD
jgi:hypothetical protein